jgi:uncharacterized repeat protein (TIGR03803 family)
MVCVLVLFCAATAIAVPAQVVTTLTGLPYFAQPSAPLIQGTDGNLYGITGLINDGCFGSGTCGQFFQMTPQGVLTTLYTFCSQTGCVDGSQPSALLQAADGTFYGTTASGGAYNGGTVFRISASGVLSTLYSFCSIRNCKDGANPRSILLASDGQFYGTTTNGGFYGCGTLYRITAAGSEVVLHDFGIFGGADGCGPNGLVEGTDGLFYGTASRGGPYNVGTFFSFDGQGGVHLEGSFVGRNGANPNPELMQATDGSFYGTTSHGGANNNIYCSTFGGDGSCGTAFKFDVFGNFQTLYSFCSQPYCTDGAIPYAGLAQARDGNFYGATHGGGLSSACGTGGCGTLFEMNSGGGLATFYSFDLLSNGAYPDQSLVLAADGTLYGTTWFTAFSLSLGPPLVPTTTFLTSTPNPSNLGEPVTMTATVTAQDGSTPNGTVAFTSNGASIGSASLNGSGVAVLVYAGLSAGTDSLTAVYQGSGTLFGSTSNTVLQLVGASMTSAASSPNPSMVGQDVTITATVGPGAPGGPMPTGSVSFTSNGTAISGCTAVLLGSSLTAVCTTSTLAVGTDAIVATYSGDSNYSGSSGMVSQIVNPLPVAAQFVPVMPCRLYDSRPSHGGSGPIQGGTSQDFDLPLLAQSGPCGSTGLDLSSATTYSLNITVIPHGTLGYLTLWPSGEGQPTVSTLNSVDGRVKANAAITPAGTNGAVSVYVTNTTDVVIDIDGYFKPVGTQTLAFYPLPPCRVADTRHDTYPEHLGPPALMANTPRDFPVLASTCNIPSTAQAYSLNFTVVPMHPVGYLSVWPTGQSQPVVSTLNDQTGTIVANAAIVPAGTGGAITVFSTDDTQLLIDINGYFAMPTTQMPGLSLYALTPCRALDTRRTGAGQPFSGKLAPIGIADSPCGPPATAQAYVFNATVVPVGPLGYLALWPDGEMQPVVSTLNAVDGAITNNMAIVPTNNGSIDAYAGDGLTQLLLDLSSYFAP